MKVFDDLTLEGSLLFVDSSRNFPPMGVDCGGVFVVHGSDLSPRRISRDKRNLLLKDSISLWESTVLLLLRPDGSSHSHIWNVVTSLQLFVSLKLFVSRKMKAKSIWQSLCSRHHSFMYASNQAELEHKKNYIHFLSLNCRSG
jgi:hypothetical protein